MVVYFVGGKIGEEVEVIYLGDLMGVMKGIVLVFLNE